MWTARHNEGCGWVQRVRPGRAEYNIGWGSGWWTHPDLFTIAYGRYAQWRGCGSGWFCAARIV